MRTKEEYYELVKSLRRIVSDPLHRACTCPKYYCEWHGRCVECVTLHRYNADHVPNCFQAFINEKLEAVAAVGELQTEEKPRTTKEYWDYVRERDKAEIGGKRPAVAGAVIKYQQDERPDSDGTH